MRPFLKVALPALVLLLRLGTARAQVATNGYSAPVAPIRPAAWRGFTNAIVLQNNLLRAVIVPEIGRITDLTLLDSPSPLRADPMLDHGKSTDTNGWANYGGSWLWPAAQNRWEEVYGHNWPPPFFDALPWTATAWRRADGADFCRLQLSIGEPLHIRITRDVLLRPKSARLEISQRTERILASTMPVTLWNVVQIGHADEIIIPVDTDPTLTASRGLSPLYETHIDPAYILPCSNAVVITPQTISENKVGSSSPRGWIAARRGQTLTILRATPADTGNFPDGGSRVTLFTSKPLGYSEIEANSQERNLAPGESLTNTVTISLYRITTALTAPALAIWTRQLVGELPFDTAAELRPSTLTPP